jgi:neutral ceramidase
VVYFLRGDGKPALAWYHFSAHPVCFQDTQTGPDWPGIVAQKIQQADGVTPSFLQGHIGDVNPGDGKKWIGDAEPTATAVALALHHAMNHSELVPLDHCAWSAPRRGCPTT